MAQRYQVPCQCGRSVAVEAAQAGRHVACACGKLVEVPTLLRLRRLPTIELAGPADEVSEAGRAAWEWPQRVALLGAGLLLVALLAAAYLAATWPLARTAEDIHRRAEILSPAELLVSYDAMAREGPAAVPNRLESALMIERQKQLAWFILSMAAAACGAAMLVFGALRTRRSAALSPLPSSPFGGASPVD